MTLAYDDGQVQSYKGLLALISPWLEQLLLAAGGHCDMVILPGIDSQSSPIHLFVQKFIGDLEYSENNLEGEEDVKNSQFVLPVLKQSPKKEIQQNAGERIQPFICDGSTKCKRTFVLKRTY